MPSSTPYTYNDCYELFTSIGDYEIPRYSNELIATYLSGRYEGLYPCYTPLRMKSKAQHLYSTYRDYIIEWVKTYQYEYNPILNYDMEESENITRNADSTTTTESATYLEGGGLYPENRSSSDGNSGETRTLRRSGNIGVMTSADIIAKQRTITDDPLQKLYCVFLPLFNIDPIE